MSFGIPYAHVNDDGSVTCPVCSVRVVPVERKDFESFSGREYAEHYASSHSQAPSLPAEWRDEAPCVDDGPHVPTSNEHGDAWCSRCGERLLIPGYAGGPNQYPGYPPEPAGDRGKYSPRHTNPRCKECGELLGDADRAEVYLNAQTLRANAGGQYVLVDDMPEEAFGPFLVHADPCSRTESGGLPRYELA